MSTSGGKWDELASQNERLIQSSESVRRSADVTLGEPAPQWAELASQSERLADSSDPLFGLASSRHGASGMRRVATAA